MNTGQYTTVALVALGLLSACGNSYSPPEWLQGVWESDRRGGDFPSYDRWEIGKSNLHQFLYRNGELRDKTDYSDFGYDEVVGENVYTLISPLDNNTTQTFTRDLDDPDTVNYEFRSPFVPLPDIFSLHRIREES